MNYKKCMKQLNCKVCSDQHKCKDDVENKEKKKNYKRKKAEEIGDEENESKSYKGLSR